MIKIGTHDSATGEKSKNLLSWLVRPFAQTQSKTIKQQYEAGCRSFDIRVRPHKGTWYCAHGVWMSKRTAEDIINEINSFSDRCQVQLTYEGSYKNNHNFKDFATEIICTYDHIIWGHISVKYGEQSKGVRLKYSTVYTAQVGYEGGERGFLPLDGRSWHTYLPLPRLWNKIYTTPHVFNEDYYIFVDFL